MLHCASCLPNEQRKWLVELYIVGNLYLAFRCCEDLVLFHCGSSLDFIIIILSEITVVKN